MSSRQYIFEGIIPAKAVPARISKRIFQNTSLSHTPNSTDVGNRYLSKMTATQHWCQMRANRVEVLERFNRILRQTAHHFPVKECYLPSPGGGNTGYIEVMTLKSTIRTKISMLVRDDSFLKKSEYEYSTVTRHVHTPEPCRPRYLCTDSEELEPDRDRSPSPLQTLNGNDETDGVATSRRGNHVPSVVSTLEGSNPHTRRVAHPQAPVGEVARERRPLNTYLSLAPETMGPETGISTTNNASGPYTIGNGTVNEPATASSKPPGWTDPLDPPCNICHREATVWMVESKDWSSRLHLAIPFCMACALEPNTFRTILVKQMWPMVSFLIYCSSPHEIQL